MIAALLPVCGSGACGDSLTWTLDGNGSLTVSGTGKMKSAPWRSKHKTSITSADARLALRRSVGWKALEKNSPQFLACGADSDSDVTLGDARLILRASVGLEDPKTWAR